MSLSLASCPGTQQVGARHWLMVSWYGNVEAMFENVIYFFFLKRCKFKNLNTYVLFILCNSSRSTTAVAGAGWISKRGWHRAVLCPSSALEPTLGHTCDSWVVELKYLHSRYCPSCFSTSFFCSKLLFIFKIDFILIFHACGSRDKVLDRFTSQVSKECVFPALTELCCWIFVPQFSRDRIF